MKLFSTLFVIFAGALTLCRQATQVAQVAGIVQDASFADRPASQNATLERESRDDLARPRLRSEAVKRIDEAVA
jgi:hypothetical protein